MCLMSNNCKSDINVIIVIILRSSVHGYAQKIEQQVKCHAQLYTVSHDIFQTKIVFFSSKI